MKEIVSFEIKRGMKSIGTKVAFFCACLYMFVQNILPAIQDMMVDIDFYLPGSGRNIYSSGWYPAGELQGLFFYFYFYGIIVALPFGVSYCLDRKSGYMKNICNRVSKNKYVVAKYIAVFITGGMVSAIPIALDFLVFRLIKPHDSVDLSVAKCILNPIDKWGIFTIDHLYIAAVILCAVWFVFGGALATLSLLPTVFSDNIFLIQLFPFFVMMFIYYAPLYNMGIDMGWSPLQFLQASSIGTPIQGIVVSAVIVIITFLIFYFRERKRDIL